LSYRPYELLIVIQIARRALTTAVGRLRRGRS